VYPERHDRPSPTARYRRALPGARRGDRHTRSVIGSTARLAPTPVPGPTNERRIAKDVDPQDRDERLLDWEWLREQEYSLRASALADDNCCSWSTFFQSRIRSSLVNPRRLSVDDEQADRVELPVAGLISYIDWRRGRSRGNFACSRSRAPKNAIRGSHEGVRVAVDGHRQVGDPEAGLDIGRGERARGLRKVSASLFKT
jgi:hypothetical protein